MSKEKKHDASEGSETVKIFLNTQDMFCVFESSSFVYDKRRCVVEVDAGNKGMVKCKYILAKEQP